MPPDAPLSFGRAHARTTGERWWWIALVALAAAAFYANSFSVPFIFDDGLAIVDNPTIRHLTRLGDVLSPPADNGGTANGRPLVNLTLAINYALGGTHVAGYHVFNLCVHMLAALALFGIVARTLRAPRFRGRFAGVAEPFAALAATGWALHPLQTESVTYVVQRAESLAGLFLLLTLYGFIRSLEPASAQRWRALAIVSCALGMATKETMVTAPVLVWLYDRTFAAGAFMSALRQRGRFHAALAGCWAVLGGLVIANANRGGTAGFGVGVAWWEYALTQADGILRYLSLAAWPSGLVFDYGFGFVSQVTSVLPQLLAILGLLAAAVIALIRWPVAGFLAAALFILLSPSSSIVPVATQTLAEHRMYLPLAAAVLLAASAACVVLGRRSFPALLAGALALGVLTLHRNHIYRSELRLWSDTVAKRPDNARAQNNLGKALVEAGQIERAMQCFGTALRLLPDYPETHNNYGYALERSGRLDEAAGQYAEAVRLRPTYAQAHANLGTVLTDLGRPAEALPHFEQALAFRPDFVEALWGLGNALAQAGRPVESLPYFDRALQADPQSAAAHSGLGAALELLGKNADAESHYREAVRLQPDFAEALNNLANLEFKSERRDDALRHYEAALRAKPAFVDARVNFANALLELGRPLDAEKEYRAALQTKPGSADANFGLGNALAQLDRMPEAIAAYQEAVQADPGHVPARANLGNALLSQGRVAEAIAAYEAALQLSPDDAMLRENLRQARAALRGRPAGN
jgi:tetratricopeptide (TPR) repeat protein